VFQCALPASGSREHDRHSTPRWRERLPSSRCQRLWCTVAATRSSQSATATHLCERSPVRGCSGSNGPRPRSPIRSRVRSRQRCLRFRRSRSRRQQREGQARTAEAADVEAAEAAQLGAGGTTPSCRSPGDVEGKRVRVGGEPPEHRQ